LQKKTKKGLYKLSVLVYYAIHRKEKKSMKAKEQGQLILQGILTEQDVVRAWFRRNGAKGGSVTSKAKRASSRANIQKAIAVRKANFEAKKAAKGEA